MTIDQQRLLIIDFGSQYAQLIARRVRELGVYCEVYGCHATAQAIQTFAPNGVILSGGPETVNSETTPRIPDIILQLGCPVLGICYGMQAMAKQLGGEVISASHQEFGAATLTADIHSPLFDQATLQVWMSHGDQVKTLPPGFIAIGSSENTDIAAMADEKRKLYGLQFHPEVTHTPQGTAILKRFIYDICQCQHHWTFDHIIDDTVTSLQQQIGDEQVILGLSGGVDSAVAAALLHRAIGDQLTCVFVDTGLLRLNEGDEVMHCFAEQQHIKVIRVNAKDRFLAALAGIQDPEIKRKRIGYLFIDIFEETAKQLSGIQWLAQGTIYPDVIESAADSGKAHVIKSHHNVGGLPERLNFKLIEPLRRLFKDEVRHIGTALGLPHTLIYRHPFPGPGLAVRILAEIKDEYIQPLQQADAIFIELLRNYKLYDQVSQAFAVFLPVKSVAVKGDARRYEYVIALRAVETIDFMTARWAHLPYALLDEAAHRITNEVPGISRVVYDISGKPPATIEWE